MTLSTVNLEQPFDEVEELRKTNETLKNEIAFLKEQLEWFKRQIFGQKAEKFIEPNAQQLCFEGFDSLKPTAVEEKKPVAAHTRKKRQVTGKDKISFPDNLPIERQVIDIPEEDKVCSETGKPLVKSRQLLSQWVLSAGSALKPLYRAMLNRVLQSNNIFYDETPLDMLKPGKGKAHQAYMWVLVGGESVNPSYRVYDFCINRCHYNAADMLKNYHGRLHSDKYGAYEALANKKQLVWCPCWSHIRRKFIEAESGDPAFRQWVLRKIKYLFMLERVAWARSEEDKLKIRQEKETPIIDELIAAVKDKLINGKILPKSKFREALGYFCGLAPHLKNYTKHPWARLDNNIAERAVRPLAIGRKNWLFVGNEEGGEAAAVLLSLVQTCRAIGVNPRDYLEDVMRRLQSHPANKIHELLPDDWAVAKGVTLRK